MKAIIITRVSTEEQKEAGNSLPTQIREETEIITTADYVSSN